MQCDLSTPNGGKQMKKKRKPDKKDIKNPKRPPSGKPSPNGVYQVKEDSHQRDGYAFAVNDGNKARGIIHLQLGGVELKDVLIDSGASCNIVDKTTWESFKQKGVKCTF
ncbi:hypothetical protein ACROYT_G011773 [Oculina patagonica]